MRMILLFGFMCLYLLAPAQPSKKTMRQAERKIESYLREAKDSLMVNLPHTVAATQRAIDLAKSNRLTSSEQKCYLTLADFYAQYKRYDYVVRSYDRAIALGLPNTHRIHYKKLPFLEKMSNSDQAIRDATTIAEIARLRSDQNEESKALVALGNIYGKRGEDEKSVEFLEKAERVVSADNLQQQAWVQGYQGDNFKRMKQNRKAEKAYRNSISNGNQVKDTFLMVQNFDRINDIYRQEKRSGDLIALNNSVARNSISNSAPKTSPKDSVDLVIQEYGNDYVPDEVRQKAGLNLASAYLENNANEEAIGILEDINDDIPEEDLEQNSTVHKLLSQAYDQSGKYAEALVEYKEYVRIQDSLLKQKDLEIAASLQKTAALQELENQVTFLEKDKELDAKTIALTESNVKRQRTISIAVVLIALITLISLLVVMRKNNAKTRANNLLELKSLRTKMNPHFIFNSLNSVNHFIAQNDEKSANQYLSKFSKLMRDVLDSSDKDFIPLDKEIELLQVYLALEHQRFSDKFDYEFTVDEPTKAMDYMIPPMLVQPFIENAIWHGLRYIDYPGVLSVRFFQQDGQLMIEVEDNGIGRAASRALKTKNQSQHQSSGIKHSKSRIYITNKVYGESISIDILDKTGEASGTLVQIGIQNKHGN